MRSMCDSYEVRAAKHIVAAYGKLFECLYELGDIVGERNLAF